MDDLIDVPLFDDAAGAGGWKLGFIAFIEKMAAGVRIAAAGVLVCSIVA